MAASATLKLDTTGPAGVAASIDAGAAASSDVDVSLAVTTTDPSTANYTVKIWGDVDAAANPNIQATEATSAWITLATPHVVRLSAGDAVKTLNVRVRDHLLNESGVASDTITLNTTVPVVSMGAWSPGEVSEKATKDTSTNTFSVDVPFEEYKVKVVAAAGDPHTSGVQIPTTAGSTNMSSAVGGFAAATGIAISVKGTDLKTASAGDGDKIVKVFVRSADGDWSI